MKEPFLATVILETLWPTRCALCNRSSPTVICTKCEQSLQYLDTYQACPRCGAPWGRIQCDRCNPVISAKQPAPSPCVSVFRFDQDSSRLIKTYKDQGEQRIAEYFALYLSRVIPPEWKTWAEALTYIPATKKARRRRGFDHMQLIGTHLSHTINLPLITTLSEPHAQDQREFGRDLRMVNAQHMFQALEVPQRVLLIDDVITTGSTLYAAQKALHDAGCESRIATIARV